ncbi:DMT family transporter [Desulfovibrio desulfuricans]|uniref:DMT family transporter n=1 Tax=Desulfovibrio desulfuricans TaxID=876 RepID=A0A4V1CXL1_DESDE|nr:DMT family transporter [Desulfovibrio desulfuricans]QCC86600.1 DMT family transporter [Desulfovibrio desulfuricans]
MYYIALVVFAGCVVALQPPINAALGRTVGLLESGLVSFAVGTIFLAAAVLLLGRGSLLRVVEIPAWQLSGGVLGAFMVVATTMAAPRIGVLSTLVAMIFGNLVMAAIIDHKGWFGLNVIVFDWRRLLGLALVLAGIALVVRR